MKDYALILSAPLLFSVQFLFTKKYQLTAGADTAACFFDKAISPLAFALILLIRSGFQFGVTVCSVLLALLNAVLSELLTLLSLRALANGSIANYSLYLLCGGMLLPILYGVCFGGDDLGVWRLVGIGLILCAVAVRFDRTERTDRCAFLCQVALFLLNGLVGVISSFHQGDPFDFPTVSADSFMIWTCLSTSVLGAVSFLTCMVGRNRRRIDRRRYATAAPWACAEGICNGAANLALLVALLSVEPSLQYPVVTGGTVCLSALLGFFVYRERLSTRAWLSVALAVLGTCAMLF